MADASEPLLPAAKGAKDVSGGLLHSHLPLDVRKQWYAIALSDDLPKAKAGQVGAAAAGPMSTSLLGDPLVLWRDLSGKAYCVADKCPHRSAPLSLGKVNGDTGHVECIYHGWQIDGVSGKVVDIPAMLEDKTIPSNAKVQVYPLHEQDGVVYVWPGSAEDAVAAKPPRDSTDSGTPLADPSSGFVMSQMCLDLPIDHALMIENLLDPAHVPFTHEGTIGNRKKIERLQMTVTKTANGFRGSVKEGQGLPLDVSPCFTFALTVQIRGLGGCMAPQTSMAQVQQASVSCNCLTTLEDTTTASKLLATLSFILHPCLEKWICINILDALQLHRVKCE